MLREGLSRIDGSVDVADERIDVAAADGETLSSARDGKTVVERARSVSGFLEADAAAEIDEAIDREQRFAGENTETRTGTEIDDNVVPSRAHDQTVGVAAIREARGEIQRLIGQGALVDLHVEVGRRELEDFFIDAVEPHRIGMRLQRRVGRSAGFDLHHAEIHALHAEAVEIVLLVFERAGRIDRLGRIANKRRDIAAADRETLARADDRKPIVQCVGREGRLLKADAATQVDEAIDRKGCGARKDAEPLARCERDRNRISARADLQAVCAEAVDEVERLARSRAVVHLDGEILGRNFEDLLIDAEERNAVGLRTERRVVRPAHLHLEQAEVHAFGPETVEIARLLGEGLRAIDSAVGVAHEHANIAAAEREALSCSREIERPTVVQRVGGKRGALKREAAAHINEVGNRQGRRAGRNTQAIAALEIDHDIVTTGLDLQAVLVGESRRKVDRGCIKDIDAIDLELHVSRREFEGRRIETIKRDRVRVRLQRGVGAAAGLDLEECEIETFDTEAVEPGPLLVEGLVRIDAAVGVSDESRNIRTRDRQNTRRCDGRIIGKRKPVGRVGLLETEPATQIDKVRKIELHLRRRAGEFAARAVDVQREGLAGAGKHVERGGREIKHRRIRRPARARAAGAIDLRFEIGDRGPEIIETGEAQSGRIRLKHGPVAVIVGGGRIGRSEEAKAEVEVAHDEADRVRAAAIHADEGVHSAAADREHVGRERRAVFVGQRDIERLFLDPDVAGNSDETK